MHRVKSYDQNNIRSLRKAISFVFWARQGPQSDYPEEALPIGVPSSSLYYLNQQDQENGGSLQAIKIQLLYFCPPSIHSKGRIIASFPFYLFILSLSTVVFHITLQLIVLISATIFDVPVFISLKKLFVGTDLSSYLHFTQEC